MFRKRNLFLLLALVGMSPASMRAGACVPSSVTSATLQIAGDNYFYAYVNGTAIGNCVAKNCYGTYASYPVPAGLINLPPADNILAVYISDSGGGFASGG